MGTDCRSEQDDEAVAPPIAPLPGRPFFPDPEVTALAIKNRNIAVWCWDIVSNRMTWSSNLGEIQALPDFDGSFSSFEKHIHPDDRAGVIAAIEETLRSHNPHRTLYRLRPQPDHDEHWIEISGAVALDGERPVRLVGTCRNVTARVRIHRELRERTRQQEAVMELGELALTENNLQKFFDDTVKKIADILGTELVKILELVPGDAELLLRAGVGWEPGLIGNALVSTGRDSQAGYTLAAGGPIMVEHLPTETRFTGQPLLHDHKVLSGVTTPIAGRDGRAYGVLGAHTARRRRFSESEVSFVVAVANVIAGAIQRLHVEQRQQLMIRELRHRSGNLFAQLLALFSQTAKSSKNLGELVTKYESRVMAMANAHRLITEGGWKSASLTQMLNILLAPTLERFTFVGPDVFLDPEAAFGLSMAVHELATNASKFGSLSARGGTIEVTWVVNHTAQGLTLSLTWKELGGPPPRRVRRPGFGSKLISTVIQHQLNGMVENSFGPEGLEAHLIVPLTHERWPGARRPIAPEDLP